MKKTFIIAYCMLAALCGTANAQSQAFTETATVKSHNANLWGLVYRKPLQRTKRTR